MMRGLVLLGLFLAADLLVFPKAVKAQDSRERFVQERLIENRKFRELEKYVSLEPTEKAILAEARKFLFDAGGWVDVSYIEFHNDDNNKRLKDVFDADLSVDTRVWAKATFRPNLDGDYIYEHSVYARFKNLYVSRWPKEGQPAVQDDNDGPHVDLLYADVDLRWAEVRAGRQYLYLGQGISYANVHDGVRAKIPFRNWELASFFSTTLPYEENIDYSVPGFDKTSERYFSGTELSWFPRKQVRLYGFFLSQQDRSDPNPSVSQDYAYHSQHWGLGGSVAKVHGFSAWAEYILETGSSAIFASQDRNEVVAHGANVGADYEFSFYGRPDFTVEYAFGSGDKDRTSVTNTEGGNRRGKDHNFLSFGIYPAGYALAPTLSNLHILRAAGSVHPLDRFWQLKQLNLVVEGYFYWKDERAGGIYDVDATDPGKWVGQEFDAGLLWRVLSDVMVAVRYGMFFPGSAYSNGSNDPEIYLTSTFTFSV